MASTVNPVETFIATTYSFANPSFELRDLSGFPYNEYAGKQGEYEELAKWFSGEALEETQEQGDKAVEIYPLKVNPIRTSCLKHAYALFGEFPDDITSALVLPRVIRDQDQDTEVADDVEDALEDIWYKSNGSAIQMEAGVLSQIYGGAVFKVAWYADEGDIKIEKIHPKTFIAIPYENDYFRLKKAWVIRQIDRETAKEYGVILDTEKGWYIEYWTEDEYEITINSEPVVYNILEQRQVAKGANPFGFVPFVYIPHQRSGEFWGDPLITESAIGITKEINLRKADAGDATSDQSHGILVMRNVKGSPQLRKLANGQQVIDLGVSQTVTGGDLQPDLFAVTRSEMTESVMKLTASLSDEIRRDTFVPAVAEGEDEGSQRSAATLVMRMWPLTSHVKSERAYWNAGLNVIHNMVLSMMKKKSLYNIETKHINAKLRSKWHPTLPRDRQAFMEELVARMGVQLGSPEHLLSLAGDVEDIELVMEEMREWLKYQEDIKPQKETMFNGSQGNSGGSQKARDS
jgi:hypothetical protein